MRTARALPLLLLLGLPPLAVADPASMAREYAADRLDAETYGVPLAVHSASQDGERAAEVSGLLDAPFAEVAALLADPEGWCQFVPLIQNVKACLHEGRHIAFHAGPKGYAPPEQAYRFDYRFAVQAHHDDYMKVRLHAERGPLGTRDHRLQVEALAVAEGTYLRVRSGYESSLRSRFVTGLYLATVGRQKVGFTVVGQDPEGDPDYVRGIRGVVERNAVRWYLALQAYLAIPDRPRDERFMAGARRWYQLTERFPRQLLELPRDEYLTAKTREYAEQRRLQQEADT